MNTTASYEKKRFKLTSHHTSHQFICRNHRTMHDFRAKTFDGSQFLIISFVFTQSYFYIRSLDLANWSAFHLYLLFIFLSVSLFLLDWTMDDQLLRMLAPTTTTKTESKSFISSKQFSGAKLGYVFRNGDEGVGYYADSSDAATNLKKRKWDLGNDCFWWGRWLLCSMKVFDWIW